VELLKRIIPGGVPIRCVFPECTTTWAFNMTQDQDAINRARLDAGWKYMQAMPSSDGLVWGWACNEPSNHVIEGAISA
jgi:hypothetical protein